MIFSCAEDLEFEVDQKHVCGLESYLLALIGNRVFFASEISAQGVFLEHVPRGPAKGQF